MYSRILFEIFHRIHRAVNSLWVGSKSHGRFPWEGVETNTSRCIKETRPIISVVLEKRNRIRAQVESKTHMHVEWGRGQLQEKE